MKLHGLTMEIPSSIRRAGLTSPVSSRLIQWTTTCVTLAHCWKGPNLTIIFNVSAVLMAARTEVTMAEQTRLWSSFLVSRHSCISWVFKWDVKKHLSFRRGVTAINHHLYGSTSSCKEGRWQKTTWRVLLRKDLRNISYTSRVIPIVSQISFPWQRGSVLVSYTVLYSKQTLKRSYNGNFDKRMKLF